ncbi:unnamed protein product [Lactuca saligna]|uniref:Uncharacterized protein n=1 Tax=Lactuca saligna TaxID=75948 RepID=A0AA36E8J9_LACSI|nr:unnamed protein product [Lactuca saligna]
MPLSLETLQLVGHSLHQVADDIDALILIQLTPQPFFGLTVVAFQWDAFSCLPFISISSQYLFTSVFDSMLSVGACGVLIPTIFFQGFQFSTASKVFDQTEIPIRLICFVSQTIDSKQKQKRRNKRATHLIEGEFHYASQLLDEMLEPGLLLGSHIIICHITPPITSHSPKRINSNFPIVLERLSRLDEIVLLMHQNWSKTSLLC